MRLIAGPSRNGCSPSTTPVVDRASPTAIPGIRSTGKHSKPVRSFRGRRGSEVFTHAEMLRYQALSWVFCCQRTTGTEKRPVHFERGPRGSNPVRLEPRERSIRWWQSFMRKRQTRGFVNLVVPSSLVLCKRKALTRLSSGTGSKGCGSLLGHPERVVR